MRLEEPQISGVFAKEPEVKLLGQIHWRKDELSEWKTLKTQARVEGSQYLYARDGDTELMDQGLDFKLEMRKGVKFIYFI